MTCRQQVQLNDPASQSETASTSCDQLPDTRSSGAPESLEIRPEDGWIAGAFGPSLGNLAGEASHDQLEATVCVPAYNEESLIGSLLETVRQEVLRGTPIRETLVETSGSTDRTVEIVRDFASRWPGYRLLNHSGRIGLAAALRKMIDRSKTDIIIRIDADVKFEPGTLGRLLSLLKDDRIGLVGLRIEPEPVGKKVLDSLLRTEYVLHDIVSRASPKITNVQVFRRFRGLLLDDIEAEDILVQDLVTSDGKAAKYVPDEMVKVVSPRSVLQLFGQRVRCISQARWYRLRTQRGRTPTHQPRVVGLALLTALRSKRLTVSSLAGFLVLEMAAHAYAYGRHIVHGHVELVTWHSARA